MMTQLQDYFYHIPLVRTGNIAIPKILGERYYKIWSIFHRKFGTKNKGVSFS